MELILIIVVLVLLFGGGGYWGRRRGHWWRLDTAACDSTLDLPNGVRRAPSPPRADAGEGL